MEGKSQRRKTPLSFTYRRWVFYEVMSRVTSLGELDWVGPGGKEGIWSQDLSSPFVPYKNR